MKHLIIGAGKMGKKHGAILEGLGDLVHYEDIGFNPHNFDFKGYDSALICTPPELHATVITSISMMEVRLPVFCEKPVIYTTNDTCLAPKISMVACNWRFCNHMVPSGRIECSYPTTSQAALLDLIHFVDAFWDLHGKPDRATLVSNSNTVGIEMSSGKNNFQAHINFKSSFKYTFFNEFKIHEDDCGMFVSQMETWRQCIISEIESPNPVQMAIVRTNWLLDQAGATRDPNSVPSST